MSEQKFMKGQAMPFGGTDALIFLCIFLPVGFLIGLLTEIVLLNFLIGTWIFSRKTPWQRSVEFAGLKNIAPKSISDGVIVSNIIGGAITAWFVLVASRFDFGPGYVPGVYYETALLYIAFTGIVAGILYLGARFQEKK